LRASSIDHYQLEKRYFRRDGSLVWGSLSISLLKSSPSPLVLAMVEDITDKKKAEEARYRHAAIVESPHPLKYFVLLIHWGRAKKINRFAASLKVPMLEICNLGLFETPPTRWWYMSYLAQTGS
jgi:hypothetical protein